MTKTAKDLEWEEWNVSLWMSNEEEPYKLYVSMIRRHGVDKAAYILSEEMEGRETPDGAPYTYDHLRQGLTDMEIEED